MADRDCGLRGWPPAVDEQQPGQRLRRPRRRPAAGPRGARPGTGVPLKWNPGRNPRGTRCMRSTRPAGPVDGKRHRLHRPQLQVPRPKLALFPLATGAPEAPDTTANLPGTVVRRWRQRPATLNVLYRVNTGGSAIAVGRQRARLGEPTTVVTARTATAAATPPAGAAARPPTPRSREHAQRGVRQRALVAVRRPGDGVGLPWPPTACRSRCVCTSPTDALHHRRREAVCSTSGSRATPCSTTSTSSAGSATSGAR